MGQSHTSELVPSKYPDLASALNVGVDRVKPFVDWCVANNVRGLLGEYASPSRTDQANWDIVTQRMLAYMVNNGNGLISGTQWAEGGIAFSSQPRMLPRVDNSMPSLQQTILPTYLSGAGTNFWQNFTWYDEVITTTADYAFPYAYASTTPAATCTLNIADTVTPFSGTKSAALNYSIPAGGFAGAGMHIRGPLTAGAVGGVDISKSVAAGHVLSFYAKGTTGATPTITLGTTSNASGVDSGSDTGTGNWVSISGIAPLTSTWQRYEVPLSSFLNAQVTGAQRIQRLRITAGPTNGVAYQVNFDKITIGVASTNTTPIVTVDTSTGGSAFTTGQSVTLVSTASDSNPGDSIDYVEFYSNDQKIGLDDISPYQWATSFALPGTYNINAIAFDSHGVPARSATKSLTITSPGIIVDNPAATQVGAWTVGTSGVFYGTNYIHDGNTGKGTKSVTYTPSLPTAGNYKVYMMWASNTNRATNVPVEIVHAGVTSTVTVNQRANGGVWNLLATYAFNAGTGGTVKIKNDGTNGYVVADAVKFELVP